MAFRQRTFPDTAQFADELRLAALQQLVTHEDVLAVLAQQGRTTPCLRKLNLPVTVYLVLALHLFPRASVKHVFAHLARGLRFVWPDDRLALPNDAALCYRRYQLGARPLVALYHRVSAPIATPATRGAWLWGWRVVALDGTTENLPDSPANRAYFGGPSNQAGRCGYPQVRAVYLCECGTHTIFDAGFWPYATSERVGAWRLLRSITPDMLVLWDRGFHEFDLVVAVRARGAHVLGRLPANVQPVFHALLADGSWLAYLYPADAARRQSERVLVRLICYTFDDPALVGHGETHRLITTLLDPEGVPALEVAVAYHERWEIELAIDEIDTHQRLATRTLRSLAPVGVIQEVYGLLISYNAVRQLMHEAALTVDIAPDRLSFVGTLELVKGAIGEFAQVAQEEQERLYQRLLADIAAERLPPRRARVNPRVVKCKLSKFPSKKPADTGGRQPWRPIAQSVVLTAPEGGQPRQPPGQLPVALGAVLI